MAGKLRSGTELFVARATVQQTAWVTLPLTTAKARLQRLQVVCWTKRNRQRHLFNKIKPSPGMLSIVAEAKSDAGAQPRRRRQRERSKRGVPRSPTRSPPAALNEREETAPTASPGAPMFSESELRMAQERAAYGVIELGRQLLNEPLRVESAIYDRKRHLFRVMLCGDATLDDCEKVTKALLADHSWENGLDIQSLEVSSPGVNDVLEHDRAFEAFRSFPVVVTFKEPHPAHGLNLQGNLVDRDETFVRVRQGGRVFKLERASVQEVRLVPAEDGDNL